MSISPSIAKLAAKVNHEVSNAMKSFYGEAKGKAFDKLSEEEVHELVVACTAVGENPNMSPADVHQLWVDAKLRKGWKQGEVLDQNAMTHPCLVPYEQLSPEDQVKDVIFLAVIKAML